MANSLFKIYRSDGHGLDVGPGFRNLSDALRYVKEHATESSFAIRTPEGRWYVGDDGRRAIFRRGSSL